MKFKKSCSFIVFICIAILMTELLLIIFSNLFLSSNDKLEGYQRDESAIRIITLGESTTDDQTSASVTSWPRQLEAKLKEAGHKIQVVNLAQRATISPKQLDLLVHSIDIVKPHIVISMLGINDSTVWLSGKHWYWKIRTIRILFWIKDFIASLHYKLFIEKRIFDFRDRQDFWQAIAKIKESPNPIETIELLPSHYPFFFTDKVMAANFYVSLAREVHPPFSNNPLDFAVVSTLFQKSVEQVFYLNESTFENAIHGLTLAHKYDECVNLAKKFIKSQYEIGTLGVNAFAHCAYHRPQEVELWNSVFSKNMWHMNHLITDNVTKKSYESLQKLLSIRKIQLMAMQYPTLSLELLRRNFADNTDEVIFISNEENFNKALESMHYDQLFSDRFGQSFGHATNKGNSIVASAAFRAVSDWLEKNKIQ